MKITVTMTAKERREIRRLFKWRLKCIRAKLEDLDLDPNADDDEYYRSLVHEHDLTSKIASKLLKEQL